MSIKNYSFLAIFTRFGLVDDRYVRALNAPVKVLKAKLAGIRPGQDLATSNCKKVETLNRKFTSSYLNPSSSSLEKSQRAPFSLRAK